MESISEFGNIAGDVSSYVLSKYILGHDNTNILGETMYLSLIDYVYEKYISDKLPKIMNNEGYWKYTNDGIYKTAVISVSMILLKAIIGSGPSYLNILSSVGLSQTISQALASFIIGIPEPESKLTIAYDFFKNNILGAAISIMSLLFKGSWQVGLAAMVISTLGVHITDLRNLLTNGGTAVLTKLNDIEQKIEQQKH